MFKAIWQERQILIVLLWSGLTFIGYNLFTVEATESNDKKVCEDYNGEWKNIDDYGTKACKFENVNDGTKYNLRPGNSLDGTSSDAEYGWEDVLGDETKASQTCENAGGKWIAGDGCGVNKEYADEYEEFKAVADSCESSGGEFKNGQCDIEDEEERAWEDAR